MEKIKLFVLFFLLSISTLWMACSEEEAVTITPVSFTAQEIDGSYTIVSFINDGNEIVSQFGSTNEIEISSNKGIFFSNTSNFGGWEFGDDTGEIDIDISKGDSPFDEFENDWVVVKLENNELWLYDDDFFDDDNPDSDDDNEQVKLQRQE